MSNLENKSVSELEELMKQTQLALRGKFAERVEAVKQQLRVLAAEEKVSLEVFVRDRIVGKKSRTGSPRNITPVVHPTDKTKVYAGTGRKPNWLKNQGEAIGKANGSSVEA